MKIRAIEIERDGKVYRYVVESREESSWPVPEGFKYKPEVPEVGVLGRCKCGHLEADHLPECIYKVEGCECEGYKVADNG